MIDRRLRVITEVEALDDHPDDDAICAFIEGRLEEAGASQIVSHLVVCGSCRQATAELTRFDGEAFSASELPPPQIDPGRVRQLMSDLVSRVTPAFEGDAVFAYQDPESGCLTPAAEDQDPRTESSHELEEAEPE